MLTDIIVDNTRADYVFGADTTIIAKNIDEGRVGVVREGGGAEITATKYLCTFVYRPESGASGVFDIALKGDGASFLNDGNGNLLPFTLGSDEVVGIGVDCWLSWHCNDNNQCTTDACVNYECVFTNSAQGTTCNDGHFYTATDTCNGSGNAPAQAIRVCERSGAMSFRISARTSGRERGNCVRSPRGRFMISRLCLPLVPLRARQSLALANKSSVAPRRSLRSFG